MNYSFASANNVLDTVQRKGLPCQEEKNIHFCIKKFRANDIFLKF